MPSRPRGGRRGRRWGRASGGECPCSPPRPPCQARAGPDRHNRRHPPLRVCQEWENWMGVDGGFTDPLSWAGRTSGSRRGPARVREGGSPCGAPAGSGRSVRLSVRVGGNPSRTSELVHSARVECEGLAAIMESRNFINEITQGWTSDFEPGGKMAAAFRM